jgi:hypothetical protein
VAVIHSSCACSSSWLLDSAKPRFYFSSVPNLSAPQPNPAIFSLVADQRSR